MKSAKFSTNFNKKKLPPVLSPLESLLPFLSGLIFENRSRDRMVLKGITREKDTHRKIAILNLTQRPPTGNENEPVSGRYHESGHKRRSDPRMTTTSVEKQVTILLACSPCEQRAKEKAGPEATRVSRLPTAAGHRLTLLLSDLHVIRVTNGAPSANFTGQRER